MQVKFAQLAKILSIVVLVIVLATVGGLVWFLHKNFYQTINFSKTILILRSEIALSPVHVGTYKKLVERLEKEKVGPIEWEKIKNPFKGYE